MNKLRHRYFISLVEQGNCFPSIWLWKKAGTNLLNLKVIFNELYIILQIAFKSVNSIQFNSIYFSQTILWYMRCYIQYVQIHVYTIYMVHVSCHFYIELETQINWNTVINIFICKKQFLVHMWKIRVEGYSTFNKHCIWHSFKISSREQQNDLSLHRKLRWEKSRNFHSLISMCFFILHCHNNGGVVIKSINSKHKDLF